MQLERMAANVRYRTSWEGVDLGFVIARQWFLPLWGLWWLTALPVTLLALLLLHRSPLLVGLAVWWCKPLYEPMLLFWLSRRLFGETLSTREIAGQWRRVLLPRLLANLSLWRLGGNRSLFLPVSLLERLHGAERRKRIKVLGGGQSAGIWLTLIGAHFEAIFGIGLLLLLYLLPSEVRPNHLWSISGGVPPALVWLGNGFWLLAMSVIAPFYVAGGFALYLTRRSQLEAWDLELPFRHMAPRFRTARAAALVCCAVLLMGLAPGGGARAAEPGPAPAQAAAEVAPGIAGEQVRSAIKQVLADPAFGKERTEHYWKYIGPKRKADEIKRREPFAWIAGVAEVLKYLLWVAAAIALGWLLMYVAQLREWLPRRRAPRAAPLATTLFGLPITPESLPDDVVGAIHALNEAGQRRAALSLLYRATLVRLVHDHHLRIPESATEGECQRLVCSQRSEPESAFFSQLTEAWTRCAYGHVMPTSGNIVLLTDSWRLYYEGGRDE